MFIDGYLNNSINEPIVANGILKTSGSCYMSKAISDQLKPSLLFPCVCGKEMRENIRSKSLSCRCGYKVPFEERINIELFSKTFFEVADQLGVESIIYANAEYEIDEAALPTGLLPSIIGRTSAASQQIHTETPYLMNITEIETPNGMLSTTEFVICQNPTSTMNTKQSLMILTHFVTRMVELSRLDSPASPVIQDMRAMSLSDLITEGEAAYA